MNFFFLDTSALVKHYRSEAGSARVDGLFATADAMIFISELAIVEMASAFQRLKDQGEIDDATMDKALARFASDTTGALVVIGFRSDSVQNARNLVLKHHIRTLDALHLAAILVYSPLKPVFVCADLRLIQAAKANGLQSINPLD